MQKSDRTHFILSPGRLRRKDNNLYFDKFNDEGGILTSKILPINAIDEIYILARVELDTYAMAFFWLIITFCCIFLAPIRAFAAVFSRTLQIL